MGVQETKPRIDTVIDQALLMYESGMSVEDILDAFPEHRTELREIFDITSLLDEMETKEKLPPPPPELLSKIVQKKGIHPKIAQPNTVTIYLTSRISIAAALVLFTLFTFAYARGLLPWTHTDERLHILAAAEDTQRTLLPSEATQYDPILSSTDLDFVLEDNFHDQVERALDFYLK